MDSMTGYGRACLIKDSNKRITIEISTINKKNFEAFLSIPKDFLFLEKTLYDILKNKLERGKVNFTLTIKSLNKEDSFLWDDDSTCLAFNKLKQTCLNLNQEFNPSAELILKLAQSYSQKPQTEPMDAKTAFELIEETFNEALNQLIKSRNFEGENLKIDLKNRLNIILQNIEKIEEIAKNVPANYRENLLERLKKAKIEIDLDDDRFLKELALFADKCDITEEITRFKIHHKHFLEQFEVDELGIGRKLDFLCQETFRELNTMGNKSYDTQITMLVINSKSELEKIREQIQNIC